MRNIVIPTLAILIFASNLFGQKHAKRFPIKVEPPICYASGEIEKSYVPPPTEILLKSDSEKTSNIIVNYSLFPEDAKAAFEFAVGIWEHIVESDVPINVQANWRSQDDNVLGSAGPSDYFTDFENIPHEGRFYPIAVAEKISKTSLNGSSPDIVATFNEDIRWYFGTNGETPTLLYDFATVVLHEIAHGLGFTGFFFVNGDLGGYGNYDAGEAAAFDLLIANGNNDLLVNTNIFEVPSKALYNQLVSGNLYAKSPVAIANNGGKIPRLYAPLPWNDGSSIYHLNDATYPHSSKNSLMTHAIGKGEAVHNPGPITRGLMADIGWKHTFLELVKPKDIERTQPVEFVVTVESDYELDSNSVTVYYWLNNNLENIQDLPLTYNAQTNSFRASFTPTDTVQKIEYFIRANDLVNRTFTLPTEAPDTAYSIKIEPDNTAPEIQHDPIPYFMLYGKELDITVKADDNLGIDTVVVDYAINGVPQEPFGLGLQNKTTYTGYFNFDLSELEDGDLVSYRVLARDSAIASNTTIFPPSEAITFSVEKIFDPIGGYYTTFNEKNNDFIIYDFEIFTAPGFDNASLHSPHPYPSTNNNSRNLEFSTILKHPIILYENATMSFDEVVLVEPGELSAIFGSDDFYDYVVVEGSIDKGETWQILDEGYDSSARTIWRDSYNKKLQEDISLTMGKAEWYVNREIDMVKNGNFAVGDTILVRFRLFSDPFAHGWGWAIDNLRIQYPVSAQTPGLSPGNILAYPNPFTNMLNVSVDATKLVKLLRFDIYNLYGQRIKTLENKSVLGNITERFNLSGLPSGMYLLTVSENGTQVFSKKIVKE